MDVKLQHLRLSPRGRRRCRGGRKRGPKPQRSKVAHPLQVRQFEQRQRLQRCCSVDAARHEGATSASAPVCVPIVGSRRTRAGTGFLRRNEKKREQKNEKNKGGKNGYTRRNRNRLAGLTSAADVVLSLEQRFHGERGEKWHAAGTSNRYKEREKNKRPDKTRLHEAGEIWRLHTVEQNAVTRGGKRRQVAGPKNSYNYSTPA